LSGTLHYVRFGAQKDAAGDMEGFFFFSFFFFFPHYHSEESDHTGKVEMGYYLLPAGVVVAAPESCLCGLLFYFFYFSLSG
jgi:hypothetical protein